MAVRHQPVRNRSYRSRAEEAQGENIFIEGDGELQRSFRACRPRRIAAISKESNSKGLSRNGMVIVQRVIKSSSGMLSELEPDRFRGAGLQSGVNEISAFDTSRELFEVSQSRRETHTDTRFRHKRLEW